MNHLSALFSLQYKDSCVISTVLQQYYEQWDLTWWESRQGVLIQPIIQLREVEQILLSMGSQWAQRKRKGKVLVSLKVFPKKLQTHTPTSSTYTYILYTDICIIMFYIF